MDSETTSDPDKAKIDELYPSLMKIGDPYQMETGQLKGCGKCIRRKLTDRGGVLFAILFDTGEIREWEWFD